jgi:hypothetical protein
MLLPSGAFAQAESSQPPAPASDPAPIVAPVETAPTPAEPPASPAAETPAPRTLFLTLSGGYDYGFTELLTATSANGGHDRIGANGGFVLDVGGAWSFVPLWELRLSAGLKYDRIKASDGSASYRAFPIELLVARRLSPLPLRLGAGLSLSLGQRVQGEGAADFATTNLQPSLGLVGQVDWVFPLSPAGRTASIGLRGIWQRMQVAGGGKSIDASALGMVLGVAL